eukprot:CAMPEP_0183793230 /NCGR_PEP_ID=MMETSP0803_2-20130417/3085_1 /TAXON_ID=195967 /ORGANISM="Crustomastix stigmata, Strain CCMP3273" /LENGTH=78 /DNA_ID=CAMNT_0026037603 /DNA_START=66 /DNA_END=299 /DNA_ORIENTATION=-
MGVLVAVEPIRRGRRKRHADHHGEGLGKTVRGLRCVGACGRTAAGGESALGGAPPRYRRERAAESGGGHAMRGAARRR